MITALQHICRDQSIKRTHSNELNRTHTHLYSDPGRYVISDLDRTHPSKWGCVKNKNSITAPPYSWETVSRATDKDKT